LKSHVSISLDEDVKRTSSSGHSVNTGQRKNFASDIHCGLGDIGRQQWRLRIKDIVAEDLKVESDGRIDIGQRFL
jgi:hypothetical protein